MTNEDHSARSATIRRFTAAGLVALVSLVALLWASTILKRDDDVRVDAPTVTQSSAVSSPTSTTQNTRLEVIDRLREILGVRDRAFRERNAELLRGIYTADCPCLEGDKNAIDELVTNNYHMIGGTTSIRVRRASRINTQLWLVVADFESAPLRIETEDNKLVRKEPRGSDLFQFALSKPVGSSDWLLGRVTAYEDKSR